MFLQGVTDVSIVCQVMGAYGYNIEHILMVDIIPDSSVRRAMNEINAGNGMLLVLQMNTISKLKQINKP